MTCPSPHDTPAPPFEGVTPPFTYPAYPTYLSGWKYIYKTIEDNFSYEVIGYWVGWVGVIPSDGGQGDEYGAFQRHGRFGVPRPASPLASWIWCLFVGLPFHTPVFRLLGRSG